MQERLYEKCCLIQSNMTLPDGQVLNDPGVLFQLGLQFLKCDTSAVVLIRRFKEYLSQIVQVLLTQGKRTLLHAGS